MKQRNYIYSWLLVLISTVFLGCYKDSGNYDYTAINKLSLSDPAKDSRIQLKLNDMLELEPTVIQSINKDESNLEYHWSYYEQRADGGPSDYISLSNSKKLEAILRAPDFILGRNYRVISEITDRNTGVSAYLYYNIAIVNEYNQGWILLEDLSGTAQLSFILPDGRTVVGLSKPDIGKPVKLELAARTITDDLSPSGRRIYVIGEQNGFELDYQTLTPKLGYNDLFYIVPNPIKIEYLNWPSSIGIAINNGIVHSNLTGGFPGAKRWGAALLSTKKSLDYKASPYVAGGIIAASGFSSYPSVVYDNTNKCFAYIGSAIGGAGAALTAFPSSASNTEIFDMNDVGMEMLFMDSANIVGEFNAIMKDAGNAPYLLRFKTLYQTSGSPVITLAKYQMNAPDIINLSAAAGATATPHVFYAEGNKLYRHETTSNTTTQPFSFAAGETVTKMDYQQKGEGLTNPRLVVATWNGTEGKVYYFSLSNVGDFTTYSEVFTGFGKVMDLAYKVPGA